MSSGGQLRHSEFGRHAHAHTQGDEKGESSLCQCPQLADAIQVAALVSQDLRFCRAVAGHARARAHLACSRLRARVLKSALTCFCSFVADEPGSIRRFFGSGGLIDRAPRIACQPGPVGAAGSVFFPWCCCSWPASSGRGALHFRSCGRGLAGESKPLAADEVRRRRRAGGGGGSCTSCRRGRRKGGGCTSCRRGRHTGGGCTSCRHGRRASGGCTSCRWG